MSLIDEILKEITDNGPISFRRYMDLCLYHPVWGYYRRQKVADGDYRTSPEVSPIFATCVARQLREMWEVSCEDELLVAELGGGDLSLAAGILEHLSSGSRLAPGRCSYWVLEHEERSGAFLPDGLTAVVSRIENIPLESAPFAVVLSNEFFDALPVHVIVGSDQGLREVFVTSRHGSLEETLLPPSSPELEEYLDFIDVDLPPGFRTEVNLAGRDIMQDVGRRIRKGVVITIDYGFPSHEIYSPARSHGTMVGYGGHRVVQDVLARCGETDITSHVNFSALAGWGSEVGLEVAGFTDQGNFLISLGILDETQQKTSGAEFVELFERNQSVKELVSPAAMGEVFKVLVQHKGFDSPPRMTGLKRPPYRRWHL
jgi:SAM-dependent MidA family methyltransferase